MPLDRRVESVPTGEPVQACAQRPLGAATISSASARPGRIRGRTTITNEPGTKGAVPGWSQTLVNRATPGSGFEPGPAAKERSAPAHKQRLPAGAGSLLLGRIVSLGGATDESPLAPVEYGRHNPRSTIG